MATIPEVALGTIFAIRISQIINAFTPPVQYLPIPNSMDVKVFADALQRDNFNNLVQNRQ